MDSGSICVSEMLYLRCAQLKAEAKFEEKKYQEFIDKASKKECLCFLESVVKTEMARANLRATWKDPQVSNDINLRSEQEFELYKLLQSVKNLDILALRLRLIQEIKNSLVQDFLVVAWLDQSENSWR